MHLGSARTERRARDFTPTCVAAQPLRQPTRFYGDIGRRAAQPVPERYDGYGLLVLGRRDRVAVGP